MLTQAEMDSLYSKPHTPTPWELRVQGLDRRGGLENDEWARVPLHIAKRRGFKSNRTSGPASNVAKAAEEGRIKAGIQDNERLLREGSGGSGYRTVGEMIQKDPKFA